MRQHTRNKAFMAVVLLVLFYMLYTHDRHDLDSDVHDRGPRGGETRAPGDANLPLIFIGGMPGSGTTLLRVMMDVHPDIRCGEETRIIPYILGMRWEKWEKPVEEKLNLDRAGVTRDVIDAAMASFIAEIIKGSGEPAARLCNKDPLALKDADYLSRIFPNSKLIMMVRDGRAVCHSLIMRGLTITGYNNSDVRDCLKRWNNGANYINAQCQHVGRDRCMVIRYEEFVQFPEEWMRIILNFINVLWNNAVLQHSFYVRNNQVHFSSNEKKTAQLQEPINTASLAKWVDHLPDNVRRDMDRIAPALKKFGYDPKANPPTYKYDKPTREFLKNY
ncbi:protein-tyrosine sulfotransferase 2-like [Mizuhopecten yessoensis]|uniref:protein-tyrosine sulfotransferase 2-like n=1 Tax=Mizuhopecten yessoensis TaxID=6573 RepID=UPI000B45A94B|nr:protein-tyrosine sulfotransferase 2-like [Mizuhopecten yessoensis]